MYQMVCLQIYLAHDLFEEFTVDTVSSAIASFIREGLFDLDGLNEIILSFAYRESDKNRKPQLVKVEPLNSLKVKQTAYEMWTLIRILPLTIDSLIPLGNNVWSAYTEFVQIVEILCIIQILICCYYKTRSILFSLNIWIFSQM